MTAMAKKIDLRSKATTLRASRFLVNFLAIPALPNFEGDEG